MILASENLFMKNSFFALIFLLILSVVIFIAGCQSFMTDISKLVETPPSKIFKKSASKVTLYEGRKLNFSGYADISR